MLFVDFAVNDLLTAKSARRQVFYTGLSRPGLARMRVDMHGRSVEYAGQYRAEAAKDDGSRRNICPGYCFRTGNQGQMSW